MPAAAQPPSVAILAMPEVQRFLCQESGEVTGFEETLERLQRLVARYGE